jgi:hypothetical protein
MKIWRDAWRRWIVCASPADPLRWSADPKLKGCSDAVALYMDERIPRAITLGLRMRPADVLTAQEDYFDSISDPALFDRATALSRVLVTFDDDFLDEAARRQTQG